MRGVQNLEGEALRVTGTVPLPLGDPSTQRSMNRVVAQQELERQNFRVRGSGGDAVFRPAALAASPVPRNGKIDPGDNEAITCTAKTRNLLGHYLAWADVPRPSTP